MKQTLCLVRELRFDLLNVVLDEFDPALSPWVLLKVTNQHFLCTLAGIQRYFAHDLFGHDYQMLQVNYPL